MKTSLWIVLLVAVAWASFLIGYSVSALTGGTPPATAVTAGSGGYGATREGPAAGAGGYGAVRRPESPRSRRGTGDESTE
jgi:tetrahydromethanopterin S-methyltransferase subunit D